MRRSVKQPWHQLCPCTAFLTDQLPDILSHYQYTIYLSPPPPFRSHPLHLPHTQHTSPVLIPSPSPPNNIPCHQRNFSYYSRPYHSILFRTLDLSPLLATQTPPFFLFLRVRGLRQMRVFENDYRAGVGDVLVGGLEGQWSWQGFLRHGLLSFIRYSGGGEGVWKRRNPAVLSIAPW